MIYVMSSLWLIKKFCKKNEMGIKVECSITHLPGSTFIALTIFVRCVKIPPQMGSCYGSLWQTANISPRKKKEKLWQIHYSVIQTLFML